MSDEKPDQPSRSETAILDAFRKLSDGGLPPLGWYKPSAFRLAQALSDLKTALGPVEGAHQPLAEIERFLNLPEEVKRVPEKPQMAVLRSLLDEMLTTQGARVSFHAKPTSVSDDGQLKMPWAPESPAKRRSLRPPDQEGNAPELKTTSRDDSHKVDVTRDPIDDVPLGNPCTTCGTPQRILVEQEEERDWVELSVRRRAYCKCSTQSANENASNAKSLRPELTSIDGDGMGGELEQRPKLAIIAGGKSDSA